MPVRRVIKTKSRTAVRMVCPMISPFQTRFSSVNSMSMALIPTKGTINPPAP
ncbi:MAG: hypothetical protein A4E73_00252 [Syntrophaceae bacterium PtaU1.Bin231]|nr:MAG: hypothetical protein A4E73_00252 [Syntrophaceae bacterium PtaU1.Bin231]